MSNTRPDVMLFLDDVRGIYIPRDFARTVDHAKVTGVTPEQWADLENENSESYWDTWDDVLRDAVATDESGQQWRFEQDGCLWAIPVGMEWDDATESYVWPDDDAITGPGPGHGPGSGRMPA